MEKQLPHNIDAEKAIFYSAMIHPEEIIDIADKLVPSDFYS